MSADFATALTRAPEILAAGRDLWLKREDLHELGAFKWRGALATLEVLRDRGAHVVVTASTGNHGAATAWAAARLGLRAIVFVPFGASRSKLDLIERQGAEIRTGGADMDEAKEAARLIAQDRGLPFFEDGAEPAQYEAYARIGEEILDQSERSPDAIVVPVGNGALIGGIGRALQRRAPETLLVGAAAKEAPVMVLSFEAGRPVSCERSATFADGLAARVAIPYAVEAIRGSVGRMLLVSEFDIARAVAAYAVAGIRAVGAAAAALAALPQIQDVPGRIVLVVTGRNIDEDLFHRVISAPESFPA
jgi:threonine dehydratase